MVPPDKRPPRSGSADEDAPPAASGRAGAGDLGSSAGRRKVWLKPHIRTGHLFESNSLACGKSTPELDQCIQNPTNS
jgi:hypothetical protein